MTETFDFTKDGKTFPCIKVLISEWEDKEGNKQQNWFTFGKKKAEKIVENFADIQRFVDGGPIGDQVEVGKDKREDLPF